MNRTRYSSRLGLKFSVVAAVALVIAFAVFLLLYEGITWWVLNAPEFDAYWEKEGIAAMESFQDYVAERSMSVDEAILQMNLLGHEFFVFRNMDQDEMISVVYKRKAGGYGLICDDSQQ